MKSVKKQVRGQVWDRDVAQIDHKVGGQGFPVSVKIKNQVWAYVYRVWNPLYYEISKN